MSCSRAKGLILVETQGCSKREKDELGKLFETFALHFVAIELLFSDILPNLDVFITCSKKDLCACSALTPTMEPLFSYFGRTCSSCGWDLCNFFFSLQFFHINAERMSCPDPQPLLSNTSSLCSYSSSRSVRRYIVHPLQLTKCLLICHLRTTH